MKRKVTYKTREGGIFHTIVDARSDDEAVGVMIREYAFDRIEILKIRPTVKQKYAHVTNYQIKRK